MADAKDGAVTRNALGVKGASGERAEIQNHVRARDVERPLQVLILKNDAQVSHLDATRPERPTAPERRGNGIRRFEHFREPAQREKQVGPRDVEKLDCDQQTRNHAQDPHRTTHAASQRKTRAAVLTRQFESSAAYSSRRR
jgi:hypothetical protein